MTGIQAQVHAFIGGGKQVALSLIHKRSQQLLTPHTCRGLFAFTVVVSVILSVLSALIFLSASASDAIGSTIIYLGK